MSTFRLDTYEVTVGRFRNFVVAGAGTQAQPPADGAGAHPHVADSGWNPAWTTSLTADAVTLAAAVGCDATYQTWTDSPGDSENRPIVCITWYEATAFCAWDGGFLPTESEQSYARVGGNLQRVYPWSNPPTDMTIDCARAAYGPCMSGAGDVGAHSPNGDGVWGHADLVGNAWEWGLDLIGTLSTPCDDCANTAAGANRANQGGSFDNTASTLMGTTRNSSTMPTLRSGAVGVRCARGL